MSGQVAQLGYAFLRDFVTDGDPSSGRNAPQKSEGRATFLAVDTALTSLSLIGSLNGVAAATLTALDAISKPANTPAVVYDDTSLNNGFYVSTGSSWTPTGVGLPSSYAADLSALQTAQGVLQAIQLGLPAVLEARPGDSPGSFVGSLAGGVPGDLTPLGTSFVVVNADGYAYEVTTPSIVARMRLFSLEALRTYNVRWALRRATPSPDPANDAVSAGIAWYDSAYNRLGGGLGSAIAYNWTNLKPSDGQQQFSCHVATGAGDNIQVVAPAGAVYARPYFQTFANGNGTKDDLEVVSWVDITDSASYSPDLTALTAQVVALQSLNIGPRLTALENSLGEVATAYMLGGTGFSTSNQTIMTANADKVGMGVKVTWTTCEWSGKVRFVFSNWSDWLNIGDYNGPGGANAYGPFSGECSLAYPAKNNVLGRASFFCPLGEDVFVDIDLGATVIPKGVPVYLGAYGVPASGCALPVLSGQYYLSNGSGSYAYNFPAGEAAEFATSGVTDKTANLATVNNANPSSTLLFGPTAVLVVQPATTPIIAIWGDSKEAGFKLAPDAFGNMGLLGQAFGFNVACMYYGCSGKPVGVDSGPGFSGTGLATAMSLRLRHAQSIGANYALNDYGRNDASASTPAATILAELVIVGTRQAQVGMQPWLVTQPPETTSTDLWATTGLQTRVAWAGITDSLNTLERAGPAPFAGVIDVGAACATALTGGVWKAPGPYTYDGVHLGTTAVAGALAMVPTSAFVARFPAWAVSYADTHDIGVFNVQAALDFLLEWYTSTLSS